MAQVATRVTEEEKKVLDEFCKEHDITLSQLIRRAIKEYIANHNEES